MYCFIIIIHPEFCTTIAALFGLGKCPISVIHSRNRRRLISITIRDEVVLA